MILKNVLTLQDLKHDSPLFLLRRSDNIIELKFYCKKLFYNLVDEVTKLIESNRKSCKENMTVIFRK